MGLGFAGWKYAPGLAARYAPSYALVWVYETDLVGADWADSALHARVKAAFLTEGLATRNAVDEFEARAQRARGPDWGGQYYHAMLWMISARRLLLTDSHFMWDFPAMGQGPTLIGSIASFDGQTLRLNMAVDRSASRWLRTKAVWYDSELTLIRWGDWRYLVADEELVDFCNDVNGGEPLDEFHLTRNPAGREGIAESAGRPRADHPPQLPPPFDRYLLAEPLELRVASAQPRAVPTRGNIARFARQAMHWGKVSTRIYDLELNRDPDDPVFVGMRLYAPDRLGMMHITRVDEQRCDACYVELSPPGSNVAPRSGERFSTLAPPPFAIDFSPVLATSRPTDPYEIARLRRRIRIQDWLLLELARELRK
ncbi:MAG: hypothetical protein AMXMBFR47_37400 [Planctomycetota bacterium]